MDNNNALSYSDLNSYGRCPTQFFYRKVVGIQRKRRDGNLRLGSLVHAGLQEVFLALRDGLSWNEALNVMQSVYTATIDQINDDGLLFQEEKDDQFQMIHEAQDLVTRYLAKNKDEILTWNIYHVEEEFITVLDDGTVISFTPDLIIEDGDGFVWAIDHKSTSKLPQTGLPFSDLQALLYYAGLKEMYPKLRGFVFNYLRKKLPVQPRLNKTHNTESKLFGHKFVNGIKNIDTTYEILRDFLLSEAPELMGEPAHQKRLAELRDNDRFFWMERLVVSEDQVKAVLEDASGTAKQIKQSLEDGNFPRTILNGLAGVQACERCEFHAICHSELLGWNTEMVIDEEYEDRAPKNPYESEEDNDDTSE